MEPRAEQIFIPTGPRDLEGGHRKLIKPVIAHSKSYHDCSECGVEFEQIIHSYATYQIRETEITSNQAKSEVTRYLKRRNGCGVRLPTADRGDDY